MGLNIKGIELLQGGTTRLIYDKNGKVKEHRDCFDFFLEHLEILL